MRHAFLSKIVDIFFPRRELQNKLRYDMLNKMKGSQKGGKKMAEQTLLIADSSDTFRLALCDALQDTFQIYSCRTGKEALAFLRSCQPDIFVLDLMLPELDGISLLRCSAAEGFQPVTIAFTRLASEYITDNLLDLNIGYILMKPCDVFHAAERIRDVSSRSIPGMGRISRDRVSHLLLALSFRPKHHGYSYLLEAIPRYAQCPTQSITKELYVSVGQTVQTKNIERPIRTAIEAAWAHRDEARWNLCFPSPPGVPPSCPSNAELISRLAEILKNNDDQKLFDLE